MAWQKRGGNTGPILKWKDVPIGGAVEGKFGGIRNGKEFQGKRSRLVAIEKSDGTSVAVPANAVIENNLADVPVGTLVRIVHLGMVRGQNAEYRNFDVFVDDSVASAPVSGAAVLEKNLRDAKGAQTAELMIDALRSKYPTEVNYEHALRGLLTAHGVA